MWKLNGRNGSRLNRRPLAARLTFSPSSSCSGHPAPYRTPSVAARTKGSSGGHRVEPFDRPPHLAHGYRTALQLALGRLPRMRPGLMDASRCGITSHEPPSTSDRDHLVRAPQRKICGKGLRIAESARVFGNPLRGRCRQEANAATYGPSPSISIRRRRRGPRFEHRAPAVAPTSGPVRTRRACAFNRRDIDLFHSHHGLEHSFRHRRLTILHCFG